AGELDLVRAELADARAELARQDGVARADLDAVSHELIRQAALRGDVDRLATSVDADAEVVRHLEQFQSDAVDAIGQLRQTQRTVQADMTEWRDTLADLAARFATLKDRVRADPYRTDVDALRIVDGAGTTRMGYVGNPPKGYAAFEDIFRGSSDFVGEGM